MGLSIKSPRVEKLVEEIIEITGESKTEAIRRALEERRNRLSREAPQQDRSARIRRFLEEVWVGLPGLERGRRLTRTEEEEILGYGDQGV